MKKEIIEVGSCPFCGEETNYAREDIEPEGDAVTATCHCYNCENWFREIFEITKIRKE